MSDEKKEREHRPFWYVDTHDFTVKLVEGYDCSTTFAENAGYWWCPTVGVSACYGHSLFDTKEQAVNRCLVEARKEKDKIEQAIWRLEGGLSQ